VIADLRRHLLHARGQVLDRVDQPGQFRHCLETAGHNGTAEREGRQYLNQVRHGSLPA